MRAVVQRVEKAEILVDGKSVASIGKGLLVFVGVHENDTPRDGEYLADKILPMRIFEDGQGKMNLSLQDVEGDLLLVSQFTLYGDARKGRRPSYSEAMIPERAADLYRAFVSLCRERYPRVSSGIFAADMKVHLINDGPVTLLLESSRLF